MELAFGMLAHLMSEKTAIEEFSRKGNDENTLSS